MSEGLDYAAARPSGVCLWANGKRFAARYFGPGSSGKHATRAECAGLLASGLSIVCNAEGAERDPLQGFNLGRTHAGSAAQAIHIAGLGDERPIYFALDFDANLAEVKRSVEYFDGCASEVGWPRVGVYGVYPQITWLAQNTPIGWFYQTSSWSGGKWFFGNHIEQYAHNRTVCGAECALVRSRRADFGQFPKPATSGGSAPAPPSQSTTETPWEFGDLVSSLAGSFDRVASNLDSYATGIGDIP